MLKVLSRMMGGGAAMKWRVLDASKRPPARLCASPGETLELGGDAGWRLHCEEDRAILLSDASGGLVCLNGSWEQAVGQYKLMAGGDYTVLVPSGYESLPFVVNGGGEEPGWSRNGEFPQWMMQCGDGSPVAGPFDSLDSAHASVAEGTAPPDALLWPEGGTAPFPLVALWPEKAARAAEWGGAESGGADEGEETIDGELRCIYCRNTFDEGHYLYFSPPNSKAFKDPASLPASWDLDGGRAYDAFEKPCEWRACPHCGQRLPRSFGRLSGQGDYFVFSMAGRARAGKSYCLAAMFKKAPKVLSQFGLSFIGEDAELNRDFEELKDVPFKPGPPEARYLEKTDRSIGATAVFLSLRDEREKRYVPKPLVYTLQGTRREGSGKHLVFYDNPGEHFTAVGRQDAMAEEARIAASHLAISSVVFIAYDPTAAVDFCTALKLPANEEGNLQATMLSNIQERMGELRRLHRTQAGNEITVAVLVMKWDIWASLAPGLTRECVTSEPRLDLDAIRKNSEQVKALLDNKDTGVPSAISKISRRALYFPVSAFGGVGVTTAQVKGVKAQVPKAPVEPWLVEIPFLWALHRAFREEALVPTVGSDGLDEPSASAGKVA